MAGVSEWGEGKPFVVDNFRFFISVVDNDRSFASRDLLYQTDPVWQSSPEIDDFESLVIGVQPS